MSQAVNMVEPLEITSHSGARKYEVVSTWRQTTSIAAAQPVFVKAFDDVLIIRRGTGTPKEVVSGKADVIIGLDEWGHVVNRRVLLPRRRNSPRNLKESKMVENAKPAVATVHIRLLEGLK